MQTPIGRVKAVMPHYRGFFKVLFSGVASTSLSRASKRFVSLPFMKRHCPIVVLVSVYDVREGLRVLLIDDSGSEWAFWQIFVSTRFPYLHGRPNQTSYKSLNIRIALHRMENPFSVTIQDSRADGSFDVCKIGPTKADLLFTNIQDIEDEILKLTKKPEKRTLGMFSRLDRSLWLIPEDKRSSDWRRCLITLYCVYQVNHRTAYEQLEELNKEQKKAGQSTEAFRLDLLEVTSPNALGRHGYYPSFRKIDLNAVEQELSVLFEELASLGVQSFANSGTLLGYIRDGRPIPHDDDFDIGVLVNGKDEDSVAEDWKIFRRALGEQLPIVNKGPFVGVMLSSGVQVDIFPAWVLDGRVYVYPYCYGEIGEEAVLPLGRLTAGKVQLPVPADPESVLAVNYGPTWRLPDSSWRFDYDISKRRFGKMIKRLKA